MRGWKWTIGQRNGGGDRNRLPLDVAKNAKTAMTSREDVLREATNE